MHEAAATASTTEFFQHPGLGTCRACQSQYETRGVQETYGEGEGEGEGEG